MTTDLIAELTKLICTQIIKQPGYPLSPDEPLISSGLIDSFSLVDLSIYIEEQFGVRIDDTELNAQTFDSVSHLAAMMQQRQS
jgi:acyl carrier protein